MELSEAKKLATTLMIHHGLVDWNFKFDFAKRRFGCCFYHSKTISLSKHLVLINTYESVRDTILHEIAHALTPGHHHDHVWRKKAIEIGCNGKRCFTSDDAVVIKGKYTAVCSGCNKVHDRHRKPRYKTSCAKCGNGVFNTKYLLEFSLRSEQS